MHPHHTLSAQMEGELDTPKSAEEMEWRNLYFFVVTGTRYRSKTPPGQRPIHSGAGDRPRRGTMCSRVWNLSLQFGNPKCVQLCSHVVTPLASLVTHPWSWDPDGYASVSSLSSATSLSTTAAAFPTLTPPPHHLPRTICG